MRKNITTTALVFSVATALLAGCSNNEPEVATAPETSTSSVTVTQSSQAEDSQEAFGVPTTDYLGRIVRTPSNGEGQPLGTLRQVNGTCKDLDKPANGVMFQATQPITVWSEEDGPTSVDHLVPVGYAKTAQGAALASWNYYAMLMRDGDTAAWLMENKVILTDEEKATWEEAGPGEVNEAALDQIPPVAYRIVSCDEDYVVVDIAKALPPAAQESEETWNSLRFSVIWKDNDWAFQFATLGKSLGAIDSIEGWAKWDS